MHPRLASQCPSKSAGSAKSPRMRMWNASTDENMLHWCFGCCYRCYCCCLCFCCCCRCCCRCRGCYCSCCFFHCWCSCYCRCWCCCCCCCCCWFCTAGSDASVAPGPGTGVNAIFRTAVATATAATTGVVHRTTRFFSYSPFSRPPSPPPRFEQSFLRLTRVRLVACIRPGKLQFARAGMRAPASSLFCRPRRLAATCICAHGVSIGVMNFRALGCDDIARRPPHETRSHRAWDTCYESCNVHPAAIYRG